MADSEKKITDNTPDEDEDDSLALLDRKKDYSKNSKVLEQLDELYSSVTKAFDDKTDQNTNITRAWDVYDCILNDEQSYLGNSKIYVPLVRDAVEARVTRFVGQLFPQNGHYADVVSSEADIPYETIALLDHYVGQARLRDLILPSLVRSGDVTGQYNLYIDWKTEKRHVIRKVQKSEMIAENGEEIDGADKYDDIEEEEIEDGSPDAMVLDTRDLVILPASCDKVADADVVAVALWMSKDKIRALRDAGDFEEDAANELIKNFGTADVRPGQVDSEKKASAAAGVKVDASGSKRALIYQVWSKIKVKGEHRLFVTHFAGADLILACRRNPYWCDRIPVLSVPLKKKPGTFWGPSPVNCIERVQYQANDAVNIGMDSATYSLLPIVMTDPEKNPRIGTMVLAMAALWETNPSDTKFVSMPALWKDAMQIVSICKDQIMQSLSTNPSMMPQGGAGKKPSQAEVSQQQQVALESTADSTAILETGILSPLLEWFYELDYQFREKDITVRKYGQLGMQADMQQIPPIQVGSHYTYRWYGSESIKSAQQVQQMIAFMNVLRGIPPQQLNGRKLDIAPMLEFGAETVFGPRLAPKILIDQRHQMTMDPEQENELLLNDFPVQTHTMDNDQEHLLVHQQALMRGDHAGFVRQHIMEHLAQMKAKAAEAAGPPQGAQGVPGGAGPGVPGTPRIGAQPGQTRPVQQPPGAVSTDQMPTAMPRKAM